MKCLATWFDAYPFPCKVIVSDYHLWELGISISDFLAGGRERRDWIALSEQRWKARKRGRANKSFHLVSPSPSPHLFEVRNSRAIQRETGLENRLPGWMKSEWNYTVTLQTSKYFSRLGRLKKPRGNAVKLKVERRDKRPHQSIPCHSRSVSRGKCAYGLCGTWDIAH